MRLGAFQVREPSLSQGSGTCRVTGSYAFRASDRAQFDGSLVTRSMSIDCGVKQLNSVVQTLDFD